MTFIKPTIPARIERIADGLRWVPFGISYLDDALLGIAPRDLMLLGAYSGVGKTQLATHIAMNAARSGKETLFFMLEAHQGEFEDRVVWDELSREWWAQNPYGKDGVQMRYRVWQSGALDDELGDLEQTVREKIKLDLGMVDIVYRGRGFGARQFAEHLSRIEYHSLVICDHVHYFDHDDTNEVQALKASVKLIREAALDACKPVILIAHLRKKDRGNKTGMPDIDDFHGSSDLVKIATEVVLMARADEPTKPGEFGTWLYVPKSRTAGDTHGYAGLVTYNVKTGRYSDKYKLFKLKRFDAPEEVPFELHPRWAKNAVMPESAKAWAPRNIWGDDD